jgi:sugar lactone lactonase YvrE
MVKPFVTELMNPSGLAIDRNGYLFVSCRNDGTVHRISSDGRAMQWVEGMGIATGLAFDKAGCLYVGDRSGTIFKINPDREIFVFATLEPSLSAYHMAFAPTGDLYVSGPTTSSFDRVYKVSPAGEVTVFYRGLGRPQGLAFDRYGNLFVAASLHGKRGIVRITPQAEAELVLSGTNIVGLALLPSHRALITTNNALYTLDWDVEGIPLYG